MRKDTKVISESINYGSEDVFPEFSPIGKDIDNSKNRVSKLNFNYIINDSRLICVAHVELFIEKYNFYKTMPKNPVAIVKAKAYLKKLEEIYKITHNIKGKLPREKAYIIKRNPTAKYILKYDAHDAFTSLKANAQTGCFRAIADYLNVTKPEEQNEKIVELAKNIENKKDKTPEDWEVCAALHFWDEVYLFGSEFKDVHNMKTLLKVYYEYGDMFETSIIDHDRSRQFELANKCRYLHNVISDQEYTRCIKNAMEGYYARYFRDGYLDDINNYLCLAESKNICMIEPQTLRKYSGGRMYSNKLLTSYLTENYYLSPVKEQNTNINLNYIFARSSVYNSDSKKIVFEALKGLVAIGTYPLIEEYNLNLYSVETGSAGSNEKQV